MRSETLPKEFIFNEKIDKDTLYGLYADDFAYIEEMFATTIRHFDADLDALELAYETDQPDDLKRSVHKIKPTFGYTGLLQVEAACKQFEDQCANIHSVKNITKEYLHIKNSLLDARDIIQNEYLRLKAFNAKPL